MSRGGAMSAVVILAALFLALARPLVDPALVRAENDCFRIGPGQVADATGGIWSGRLSAVRMDDSNAEISRLTFDVDSVFAGKRVKHDRDHLRLMPDEALTLVYSRCPESDTPADLGLSIGHRYLVSQRGGPSPDSILTANTVIWEIDDHDNLAYEDFYDQPSDVEATFRSVRTLQQAIGLMASDALPPTDASAVYRHGDDWSLRSLLMLVTAVAGGVWWRRRARPLAGSGERSP
jgi:hypothetical protein